MSHPNRIRGRRCGRPGLLLLVAGSLLLAMVGPVLAAQPDGPDRTLRLESVVILPDEPGIQSLVRRHLSLEPGAPVDVAALSLARQALEETGYFSEVQLYTARGSRLGQVILYVEVELNRRLRFLTGYGYEPMDGWYLNLIGTRLLNHVRPGSELRLAWRDGFFVRGLYFEGSLPTGEKAGDFWRCELIAETKAWFAYEQREAWRQDINQNALRIGRQLPLGEHGSLTAWGGFSHVDPEDELSMFLDEDEQERPAGDLIADSTDDNGYIDLWLEGEWHRADGARPWWRGTWYGTRLRASHQGGGSSFGSLELEGRHNRPLSATVAVAGRLRAAHASDRTPYHQRFQFGGAYSVRGYDFAWLSGPLGATNLVQANLELRAPLLDREAALPRVTGLLFVDTGQCWDRDGASFGWAAGAGYGVRVRLPWVQSAGFDVGFPLVKRGDMSPFVINFALGWSY